jgi:hypothetical protein
MSVDDHGLEVLKKSGIDLDGGKKEYALRTRDSVLADILNFLVPGSVSTEIINVPAPTADDECSYTLPDNCLGYILRPRKICRTKLAFNPGELDTNFFSLGLGGYFHERSSVGAITIYFSSNVADNIFELVVYKKLNP